jgi:hypothetical protein
MTSARLKLIDCNLAASEGLAVDNAVGWELGTYLGGGAVAGCVEAAFVVACT